MTADAAFLVRAPGRVNLIGDHTDYTGGLVLPMAIDRYTDIRGQYSGETIALTSIDEAQPVDVCLDVTDPAVVEPAWGRYVAGVVAEFHGQARSFRGEVSTTIPIGAGLSSSAALEVATALACGFGGDALALAQLCRRAEIRASGVPCGIMDQLSIAAGVAGHATLIDCHSLTVEPVALPGGVDVVVQFVKHRTLAGSEYGDRVASCAAAEEIIGPLRLATLDRLTEIADPVVRRRARHVIEENERVRDFAFALAAGELGAAGALMVASHESLRELFDTSTPMMDVAVRTLAATPGVYGARMTGGGFGGCVVALTEPGALSSGWIVHPVGGAAFVGSGDEP